jgi:hypothetical protein
MYANYLDSILQWMIIYIHIYIYIYIPDITILSNTITYNILMHSHTQSSISVVHVDTPSPTWSNPYTHHIPTRVFPSFWLASPQNSSYSVVDPARFLWCPHSTTSTQLSFSTWCILLSCYSWSTGSFVQTS